jgi:hypothetical protein
VVSKSFRPKGYSQTHVCKVQSHITVLLSYKVLTFVGYECICRRLVRHILVPKSVPAALNVTG